ncbi:DUF2726 domain-containing protein [Oceanisphaera pacifica]|uniref:DUF2726 domain-containing protein n=1 Tax=Oceanisphaera pacifica TaxID=2818389 RepID=A0ABS3NJ16_9GAMM|nr:DUF2726 domain-containing protein [Oceanisphaera pacifica]MBO1520586.1 DUF2726 domain-containing protein [Oceanisphaera pacifica]
MTQMLPTTPLGWIIFSASGLLILLLLIKLLPRLWRDKTQPLYTQKMLFSPEASTALRLLDEAIGQKMRIFTAISLTELLDPNPKLKKSQRKRAQQMLQGDTLDFVLCSPDDFSVKVALILSEDNLSKKENKRKLQQLQHIQAAGLPVIQLSPTAWPSAQALQQQIITACKQCNTSLPTHGPQGRVEPTLSLPDSELPPSGSC